MNHKGTTFCVFDSAQNELFWELLKFPEGSTTPWLMPYMFQVDGIQGLSQLKSGSNGVVFIAVD